MCTTLLQMWMDASVGFLPTSNWCAHFVVILLGRHARIISSDSLLTTLTLPGCLFRFSIPELSIFCMGLFHGSGGYSLAFWGGGTDSFPRQSIGICGGRYGPATGVSPSTWALSCKYNCTRSFVHHWRFTILATGSVVKYHIWKHFITLYLVMLYILI